MKVKVFFTVDVEIWCGGWNALDESFPDAFQRYIYGHTKRGEYGLTRTLELLAAHGLKGVFFTEPLFSKRFGSGPLEEIVGLIQAANQEVQLHLHTEWADEITPPLLPGLDHKHQFLWMFNRDDQAFLINSGIDLLRAAGVERINAFRAGSFGMNADTLDALGLVGINYDSSFSGLVTEKKSGLESLDSAQSPVRVGEVWEYPMSQFTDAMGRLRHAQLGACSYGELEWLLWYAAENEWDSVVILSHNFELMNQRKDAPDPVVSRRFERLCQFLQHNADTFETCGFNGLSPNGLGANENSLPKAPMPTTITRLAEQTWRRIYG